jgi:hypothetical protein
MAIQGIGRHRNSSFGQAVVNTRVRLRSGATVLVGGPSHQKGVLIIAITVAS